MPALLHPTQDELDELTPRPLALRPTVSTGLTSELWKDVPILTVPVRACLPTQRVLMEWVHEYLTDSGRLSYSGDFFGHIVVDAGRWLIEDGHHRWAAAAMSGKTWWAARVFVLS